MREFKSARICLFRVREFKTREFKSARKIVLRESKYTQGSRLWIAGSKYFEKIFTWGYQNLLQFYLRRITKFFDLLEICSIVILRCIYNRLLNFIPEKPYTLFFVYKKPVYKKPELNSSKVEKLSTGT